MVLGVVVVVGSGSGDVCDVCVLAGVFVVDCTVLLLFGGLVDGCFESCTYINT